MSAKSKHKRRQQRKNVELVRNGMFYKSKSPYAERAKLMAQLGIDTKEEYWELVNEGEIEDVGIHKKTDLS